jgi:hypothetical protein
MARVFDALHRLALQHGSYAATARVVDCSGEMVRAVLIDGAGTSPALAARILRAAGEAPNVERRQTALERWRAYRAARRTQRHSSPDAEQSAALDPELKRALIERAAEERRAAAAARLSDARAALGPPVSSQSALDTLAALVAGLLVRRTVDPVAELDLARDGSFVRRVERHVLAALLDTYGNPNAVAMATRGRPVGASLQRNFARHKGDLGSLSDDMAREVQALLDDKRGAWAALLAALEEGAARAAE